MNFAFLPATWSFAHEQLLVRLELIDGVFQGLSVVAREALLRDQNCLTSPPKHETLESIAARHGISRERVRQIGKKGAKEVGLALDAFFPGWEEDFHEHLSDLPVVDVCDLAACFQPVHSREVLARIVLKTIGWERHEPRSRWWTNPAVDLNGVLRQLDPGGPLDLAQWEENLTEFRIPKGFLEQVPIPGSGLLVVVGQIVVRERLQRHDLIVHFLRERGEATTDEIIETLQEGNRQSISEYMRRHETFQRIPVRRTWTLAGSTTDPVFTSTLPVVLEILENHGPLSKPELIHHVLKVHPVTTWRINQVLDNQEIGKMPDGRLWLVRYGAKREMEREPSRPDTMVASNAVVGVRLAATSEMLRGSSFQVQRWLAWRLGLKAAPQALTFQSAAGSGEDITVSRAGSGTTISSIRALLRSNGIEEGQGFAILFDVESLAWKLERLPES